MRSPDASRVCHLLACCTDIVRKWTPAAGCMGGERLAGRLRAGNSEVRSVDWPRARRGAWARMTEGTMREGEMKAR